MKMKMKRIGALLLTGSTLLGMTSCIGSGGTKLEPDDGDKRPAIYVSVFNGGYGREWIDTIVSDYNKEHPENSYKIAVRSSKDEFNTVLNNLQAGTAPYDMFYTNAFAYKLINARVLEDITDVWETKPDGSDRTIHEMMVGSENYAKAYSDAAGKLYAVPLQESLRGFVYDHEMFLKYGLLFNEAGGFITSPTETLSKGKDGIQGTYDDGHPITETQWAAMANKATAAFGYAFNYTGKFSNYLNDVFEMIAAQYDGIDKYMLNWTFDGTYDFGDGRGEQTITLENGYELTKMQGNAKALEFMDTYLACKDTKLNITNKYTYPSASTNSYSHTDAQNDFISFTAQNKKTKMAMLIEGDWWENEAKTMFNALEAEKITDYAFRKHDYRFMTLPYFDGQAENVNVYTIAENMYMGLKKQTDEEKKAICKDFMVYSYQPKYIQNFTVVSGGVMPYDVELTPDQKAKLSPFVNNFLSIYRDHEHNKFINPMLYMNMYDTGRGNMVSRTSNGEHYVVINGLYYYSAADYMSKLYNNQAKNWDSKLIAYNTYLNNKA